MGKEKLLFGKSSLLSSKTENRDKNNSARTSNFLADLASGNLTNKMNSISQSQSGINVERTVHTTQTLNRSPATKQAMEETRSTLPRNMYGNPDKSHAEYVNSPRSKRLQQVQQNQMNQLNNKPAVAKPMLKENNPPALTGGVPVMPRIPTRSVPPQENPQSTTASKEKVHTVGSNNSVRSEERREADRRRKSQIDQKMAAIENAFLFDQSFMMSQEEASKIEGNLIGAKMRRKFTYNSIRPLPKVALSKTTSVDTAHSDSSNGADGEVDWEKVAKEAKQREYIVRENVRSLMQNFSSERTQLQKLVHHYKRELEEKDKRMSQMSQGNDSKEADTIAYLKLLRENASLKSEIEKEREKSMNLQKELESDSRGSTRSRSSSNSEKEESKSQYEIAKMKKKIAELEHENSSLEAKLSSANNKLAKLVESTKQQAQALAAVVNSPPNRPIKSPPQARPSAPVKPPTLTAKRSRPSVLLALHDFESDDPEDLPFSEGDLLILVEKEESDGDGWWTAEYAGKKGKIPSNFVEDLSQVTPEQMVAIGSFTGECEGDLEFKKGEVLYILNKEDEWWVGQKADGSVGYLPRNYVKPLE